MKTETIDQELETLAEIGLSEARRELEARGSISVAIWIRHPDGRIEHADLGECISLLMNCPEGKELFFGLMRRYTEKYGITAVIFATDSWAGIPTEKQKQIIAEDGGPQKLFAMTHHKSFDEIEAMGLVERREALTVIVQTAAEVLIVQQFYERRGKAHRIWWGERYLQRSPQSNFDGRQKMYD